MNRDLLHRARTTGDVRGKTIVNRPGPMGCGEGSPSGALRSAALGKESGLHRHVQSLALYPRNDYLRGLNSIAHANFITTTLAPMGEHRLKRRVKAMSGPVDGKRERETKPKRGPDRSTSPSGGSERAPVSLRNAHSGVIGPNRKMESLSEGS